MPGYSPQAEAQGWAQGEATHAGPSKALGVIAASIAGVLAALLWGGLGYVLKTKAGLMLGEIVMIGGAGVLIGVTLRALGKGFGRSAGWVAVVVALLAAMLGQTLWVIWGTGKPMNQLFVEETTATVNTILNLQVIIFYAITAMIAHAIASPRRYFPNPYASPPHSRETTQSQSASHPSSHAPQQGGAPPAPPYPPQGVTPQTPSPQGPGAPPTTPPPVPVHENAAPTGKGPFCLNCQADLHQAIKRRADFCPQCNMAIPREMKRK